MIMNTNRMNVVTDNKCAACELMDIYTQYVCVWLSKRALMESPVSFNI